MTNIKFENVEYQVFMTGTNKDGVEIYQVRANHGFKTPYLKEGSKKYVAVIEEFKRTKTQ